MLFNSYIFILCFLPVTLLCYFGLNKLKCFTAAKLSLVMASLIFYGYNNPSYVLVILSSIVVNYFIFLLMQHYPFVKKYVLTIGVIANIVLLGYFKYFDFLIANINQLSGSSFDYLNIALPLGISFFTFQQVSFLVDSSRGECSCESFVDYILFVTFFPQLVAGPIVSHDEMIPQFASKENNHLNYENLAKGLQAFSMGLFKKVVVADNFGKIVAFGYANVPTLNTFESALTILAYTIQIYYDFSGYCDMATGIAWMFNIELPMNFNSPYKATTIVDFWKRWHITLTRFLTKYVYIPLGGNRKGVARTYINIFLVFLVSGIWHGAGYTFILWGILHGLANILCRLFQKKVDRIPKWINWCMTFLFVNLTWVVFRAESLEQAVLLISRVFSGGITLNDSLQYTLRQLMILHLPYQFIPFRVLLVGYSVLTVAVSVFCKNTNQVIVENNCRIRRLVLCYGLLFFSLLSLNGVSTFLYFNF